MDTKTNPPEVAASGGFLSFTADQTVAVLRYVLSLSGKIRSVMILAEFVRFGMLP